MYKKKNLQIFLSYKHGLGIFSLFSIKKLTILIEYRGEYIDIFNLKKKEPNYRLNKKNIFFFKINQNFTIDATFTGNYGRLVNHSCFSNCFSKLINHGFFLHVILFSFKNIKFFEELSYDYRINPDETDYEEIICACEQLGCRKKINL
jgi:SET domain-containing protein